MNYLSVWKLVYVGCYKGLIKNYNKLDLMSLCFCVCILLGKIVIF